MACILTPYMLESIYTIEVSIKLDTESVCCIDSGHEKEYHDIGMHIISNERSLTMDADPYSKPMNNFTGSGRKNVHRLSA